MAISGVNGNQEPKDLKKLQNVQSEQKTETKETKDAPPGSVGPNVFTAAADADKNGTVSTSEQKGGMSPTNYGQVLKQGLEKLIPGSSKMDSNEILSSMFSIIGNVMSSALTSVKTDGTQKSADNADVQVEQNKQNADSAAKSEIQAQLDKVQAEVKASEAEDKNKKMDEDISNDFKASTQA